MEHLYCKKKPQQRLKNEKKVMWIKKYLNTP